MKKLYHAIILLFISTNILYAKTTTKDTNSLELISTTIQQRMLSQKITKAYLYIGNKVAIDQANIELKKALADFKQASQKLIKKTKSPKLKKIIKDIEKSSNKFATISKKELNQDNAKEIIDLSESILKKSDELLHFFNKNLAKDKSNSIIKSGQQRMLTQRIAKYYIAYQVGIKDNSNKNMEESVNLFIKNHQTLMKNKNNTPLIKKKLKKIDRLWKRVHKFYNNIENGELPRIVLDTTNKISNQMDEVTKLYIATYKKNKESKK